MGCNAGGNQTITAGATEGNSVTLVGFSRFEANEHRPRTVQGRDGKTYHVEGRLVPSFHPYPSLRRQVRERAAAREPQGEEPCLVPRTPTPNNYCERHGIPIPEYGPGGWTRAHEFADFDPDRSD